MQRLYLISLIGAALCPALASASWNCGQIDGLVGDAEPTVEQKEWAHRKFIDDGTPYGFDRINFLEIDFDELVQAVDAYEAHSKRSTLEPDLNLRPSDLLVIVFSPFPDLQYSLVVDRVTRDSIHGYDFLNLSGYINHEPCLPDSAKFFGNWRLYINVTEGSASGEIIVTAKYFVRLARAPNGHLVVAAGISHDRLEKFPPID